MSSYFEPLNLHTHSPTLVAAEVAGMDNLELVHNVVPLNWKTGEWEMGHHRPGSQSLERDYRTCTSGKTSLIHLE